MFVQVYMLPVQMEWPAEQQVSICDMYPVASTQPMLIYRTPTSCSRQKEAPNQIRGSHDMGVSVGPKP